MDSVSAEDVLDILVRPEWQSRAACNGVGPQHFFWEEFTWHDIRDKYYMTEKAFKRESKKNLDVIRDTMQAEYVEEYCDVCPVRAECAAAGKWEKFGIWGGQTLKQRFEAMTDEERETFVQL